MEDIPVNKQNKSTEQIVLDEKLHNESTDFIREHGLLLFLDICHGSLNNLLVKKGVITSDELRDEYLVSLSSVRENLKNRLKTEK